MDIAINSFECIHLMNLLQSNAKRCPNQEKTLIIWTLTTSTDSWNTQLGAGIDVSLRELKLRYIR